MKIIHIVGARPQFIKLAPLCRVIKKSNGLTKKDKAVESIIVHTGQHYDYLMSKVFFDDLQIPDPDYDLEVGSGRHGEQTGLMLARCEEVFLKERPDLVMVYGDTNSTLAGALGAAKLHIPVIHLEAGLRSYNQTMPEEINRILTDHLSSLLLCPTKNAVINLKKEGFNNILKDGELIEATDFLSNSMERSFNVPVVVNVGDIMYDSLLFSLDRAMEKSDILNLLRIRTPDNATGTDTGLIPYILCTIHRQENTDNLKRLKIICETLEKIAVQGTKVIFPLHPRTKKYLESLGTSFPHISFIAPVSYYDMLKLEKNARLIMTDSGGVQKEAFFQQVPCITLRDETEWSETVEAGMNTVTGIIQERILTAYHQAMKKAPDSRYSLAGNPFGFGNSAPIILQILRVLYCKWYRT